MTTTAFNDRPPLTDHTRREYPSCAIYEDTNRLSEPVMAPDDNHRFTKLLSRKDILEEDIHGNDNYTGTLSREDPVEDPTAKLSVPSTFQKRKGQAQ